MIVVTHKTPTFEGGQHTISDPVASLGQSQQVFEHNMRELKENETYIHRRYTTPPTVRSTLSS